MLIGIPKEIYPRERRVAATPDSVGQLMKLGFSVLLETQAGLEADFTDAAYQKAGAEIAPDAQTVWSRADLILKVRAPIEEPLTEIHEASLLREGATLISFIWPAQNQALMDRLAARKATVLAMDSVPRISRAQKLDALSSMANIGGYRAVVEAAHAFGRFFTGQVTAAGKIPPAKVFIIGVGVAGLSAIGTAKGMGAIVRATDTRPEVKDQIKSMGAEFVAPDYEEEGTGVGGYAKVMSEAYQKAQQDMIAKQAAEVDIIVTTALIPGKPAPKLLTRAMVDSMKPGSVIVDMAAEQGGNCEYTVPNEKILHNGVTIIGYADLPSRLARQSSQVYSTNLVRLMEELCKAKDGTLQVNMEDEVIRGTTVIKDGTITWPPPAPRLSVAPAKPAAAAKPATPLAAKGGHGHGAGAPSSSRSVAVTGLVLAAIFAFIGLNAPETFLNHFTVFVLACFIGYMVIWNVTPALHTPLMSVTNAISSIIVIGALIQISSPSVPITLLAAFAIGLTAVNMFGGFWVTQRMLRMFQKH
ncbi:MAG: Re/Si-specific NAD(P)(+) transhydrogenase subunit alpha [Magnetococcales bacterium]|nr:Re/Si-specific NAD(P)(+) transhydrogenase subunit alpha [Magnetococcales bacterium]